MSYPLPHRKLVFHKVFFSLPSLVVNAQGMGVCANLPAGSIWQVHEKMLWVF